MGFATGLVKFWIIFGCSARVLVFAVFVKVLGFSYVFVVGSGVVKVNLRAMEDGGNGWNFFEGGSSGIYNGLTFGR